MDRVEFLECPVDCLELNQVLGWIEKRVGKKKPSVITVLNANKLWMMSKDLEFNHIVKESDLIIPEWAIVWGANILGLKIDSPLYGVKLFIESLQWAEKKNISMFFLGAKPNVIKRLAEVLHQRYPKLIIKGISHGYLDHNETLEIINRIRDSKPDILYVAMGSPKQEFWIRENFRKINVPVSIGVGGSFDILVGAKKDTPKWARGHGWEWLYRLSQDPKAYWKRYLITNSWIIFNVFLTYLKKIFSNNKNS